MRFWRQKEDRKGKVFKKAVILSHSKQLKEEESFLGPNRLAPRPYEPESLLALYDHNPIFYACVNQIASDVSGSGWSLELIEGQKENQEEKDRAMTFLNTPNENEDLRTILESLLIDWGVLGYFGMEIVRNAANQVAAIYGIPAKTIYVHYDKDKYVQKRGQKIVWFKEFTKVNGKQISPLTGEVANLSITERANEMIFFKKYHPNEHYYGIPSVLPVVGSVTSMIGIRDYNLSFFENYAVPAYVVKLTGEWEDGSAEDIENFLNTEIKGSDNAHKTLVLATPVDGAAEFQKVSEEFHEGSFRLYTQVLREDVLMAYSMPPYRIGLQVAGQLGGNMAIEATKVYNQKVVEPLQYAIERIITEKLLNWGLGIQSYSFKFKDLDVRDLDAEVNRDCKLIAHSVMSPSEVRTRMSMNEPKKEDKFLVSSALRPLGGGYVEKDRRFITE